MKTVLVLLTLALVSFVSRAAEKLDLTYGTATAEELKLDLTYGTATAEELKLDLTYGTAAAEELKLDLSVPEGDGPFPVCILVHGGGFERGDKQKQPKHLFVPLSGAGFAWVSINYRLAPAHKYPGSVEDVETAIRWVKAHGKEYRFDSSRIVLIGESAGGYLVNMVGTKNQEDTRVAAVVSFYGVADLLFRFNTSNGKPSITFSNYFGVTEDNEATRKFLVEASPATYVRPGLPPFLLLHGNKDETVPYDQSVNFFAKLKEARVPAEFITIEGGGHGMSNWNKLNSDYAAQLVHWLKLTLGAQH
jgi:acetyl esterase